MLERSKVKGIFVMWESWGHLKLKVQKINMPQQPHDLNSFTCLNFPHQTWNKWCTFPKEGSEDPNHTHGTS